MTTSADELGRILSRLHWQCWRVDAPPLEVEPAELVAVLPILIHSGSVGLLWPRIREQQDPSGAIALALEDAYRAQIAHNEVCHREIAQSVARLREAGIDALLVKGWAVSRLYPAPLVRPAGDIDLIVRHADYARATEVLTGPDASPINAGLDLKHPAIWEEKPNDDFWNYTMEVEVHGVHVHVLAAEDQLRMLSFHFLKHEGMRPLWLADIAMTLETRPADFNWSRLSSNDSVRAQWIRTVLALAHELVGADISGAPTSMGSTPPSWLVREVHRHWPDSNQLMPEVISELAGNPLGVIGTFRHRWPSPIRATWILKIPCNRVPRLLVQWLAYGKLMGGYALHRLPQQIVAYRRRRLSS